MRIKITFSYDGTNFFGYQVQPGLRTVQEELERAVSYLNGQKPTTTVASGRTDKGVHALGQVAHFDLDKEIPCHKIKLGLNSLLPDDIYVLQVETVNDCFHARYSALRKTYIYKINQGHFDPLSRFFCYQLQKSLDVSLMREASKLFLGEHDFRSFVDSEDIRENTTRTVYDIDFFEEGEQLTISFCGNGFMKYQVRNMVGALVLVGLHQKSISELSLLLASRSRKKAWKASPTCGLYLKDIVYEEKKNS